jgi:antitoxin component YwqK of YwqJK toxin-antitoxin module
MEKGMEKEKNISIINYYLKVNIIRVLSGLENYMIVVGKIINELKREKSGRIKEYFNGKLTFDGEFLNNERNGKGKQYDWEGKLIFEGEYLNGKKWIGKERKYNDKKLILEVDYLIGKKIERKSI